MTTDTPPFTDPVYITTTFDGDTIFVTDEADNSIDIFDTSIPFMDNEIGVIHGGKRNSIDPKELRSAETAICTS